MISLYRYKGVHQFSICELNRLRLNSKVTIIIIWPISVLLESPIIIITNRNLDFAFVILDIPLEQDSTSYFCRAYFV